MCERSGSVKRLRKGEAKIQFFACGERIAELRASGFDIRAIYERLVAEKMVTMSYTGFYENFTQRQKKRSRKKGLRHEQTEAAHQRASLQAAPPPVQALTLVPSSQAKGKGGWSLEERVAALDAEAVRGGKKRTSGSEHVVYPASELF